MSIATDLPLVRLDSVNNLIQWARQLVGDLEARFHSIALMVNLVSSGKGSPEGVVKAPIGTIYLRTDGGAATTLYVKEAGTGNVGWYPK